MDEAITNRFSSHYQVHDYTMIYPDKEPKLFKDTWNLIEKYSYTNLQNKTPNAIGRLPIKNAPYVELPPNKTQVALIPESVPIYIWYYDDKNGDHGGDIE
ncbi:MAG: hypothetical protein HYW01_13160 [Deltaproteobacteria bacterium]|nr:hypothetical protein [Deltaproteobacteria bacterium]